MHWPGPFEQVATLMNSKVMQSAPDVTIVKGKSLLLPGEARGRRIPGAQAVGDLMRFRVKAPATSGDASTTHATDTRVGSAHFRGGECEAINSTCGTWPIDV